MRFLARRFLAAQPGHTARDARRYNNAMTFRRITTGAGLVWLFSLLWACPICEILVACAFPLLMAARASGLLSHIRCRVRPPVASARERQATQ